MEKRIMERKRKLRTRIKKAGAVLLALLLVSAMMPVAAGTVYAEEETVYTVTLLPGDGAGTPITYCSDEGAIAADWRSAGNCQFYYENGSICFRLDLNYCPDSFSAPDGYSFEGWKGNARYNTLTAAETTFTAKWKRDAARFTITTEAMVGAFDADGYAPVTVEVTELDFGPDHGEYSSVNITFHPCVFQGEGGTIGSVVTDEDYRTPVGYVDYPFTEPGSFTFLVWVDPETLAGAAPGTYIGEMYLDFAWDYIASDVPRPDEGYLKLTLVIPDPAVAAPAVTVSSGIGGGEDAEGESVTIPQTGENSHMGVWISLLCVSGTVLAAWIITGRKRKTRG